MAVHLADGDDSPDRRGPAPGQSPAGDKAASHAAWLMPSFAHLPSPPTLTEAAGFAIATAPRRAAVATTLPADARHSDVVPGQEVLDYRTRTNLLPRAASWPSALGRHSRQLPGLLLRMPSLAISSPRLPLDMPPCVAGGRSRARLFDMQVRARGPTLGRHRPALRRSTRPRDPSCGGPIPAREEKVHR